MAHEDSFHLGVKALIYNPDGKLLLLRSEGKTLEHYWDLPGGRIQKNESLEEALRREVFEETGVRDLKVVKPFSMALSSIRIRVKNGDHVGLIYASYLCKVQSDPLICLSPEHTQFGWFTSKEAARLLADFPAELTQKLLKKR